MTHSFRVHHFHLVWSTKFRMPLITPEVREEIYPYIGNIARKHGGALLQIGGMPDHVHLLLELRNPILFTELVKEMKIRSSALVRKIVSKDFAWQEGYGSFSVSYSALDKVGHYIRNQEEHHAHVSFEDEFKTILDRHQIPYDERFAFG